MAAFSDSITYNLFVLTGILAICLYLFATSTFSYWKNRGIPYVKPIPFFGNVFDQFFVSRHPSSIYQDLYWKLKDCNYGGIFLGKLPALLVRDPDLVERILTTDFNYFCNRAKHSEFSSVIDFNLFNLDGEQWHSLRYKILPVFTTLKLKSMFDQICSCGEILVKNIEEQSKEGKEFDSIELMSNFALDVITKCAFGLHTDANTEDNKKFRQTIFKAFNPTKFQILRIIFLMYFPKVMSKLNIAQTYLKEVEELVSKLVKDTIEYREKNTIKRNDFLQILMHIRNTELSKKTENGHPENSINQSDQASKNEDQHTSFITEAFITAQAFVFLSAGSESVSVTLGFCLYCLAENPSIQQRVHNEIDSTFERNKEWSFQTVKEMTYLDEVIQETLRIFPIAPFLFRICTKQYDLPDSKYPLEEGVQVVIPVYSIHNDPENYKSPEIFDPSRFAGNNFKPSGMYIPRICIGMKFAVLQLKVVLIRILSEYTVRLSSKTQKPFKYDPLNFFLKPQGGFWFNFEKRLSL